MPQLGLFYILLAYFVIVGTGGGKPDRWSRRSGNVMPTVFVAGGFALVAWATGNMNFASYLHTVSRHAGNWSCLYRDSRGGLGFWFNTYPAQVL